MYVHVLCGVLHPEAGAHKSISSKKNPLCHSRDYLYLFGDLNLSTDTFFFRPFEIMDIDISANI